MQKITSKTRIESFNSIQKDKKRRYAQILNRLNTPKTAKEIAVELYNLGLTASEDRNNTAPRLTELEQKGLVEVIDKKICEYTGKKVALYQRTKEGTEAISK